MRFINPKTDYAFKKIFGSDQSHDILISFLNAILYEGNDTIKNLEILNPHLSPRIRGFKDTYLDIKATITDHITDDKSDDKTVIIEMQVLNVEGFEKRILYNAAKTYTNQLALGEDYTDLQPVIALTITDFEMFSELNQLTSRFILKEKTYLTDYPIYDIELVFVELPKFHKNLDELETLADKWLYFLKTARKLETVPPVMASVPEIKRAFAIANQANLTLEELDDLEHQEIFIHDQRNAIKKGLEQGIQQGLEQGIQQGLEQGVQQGIEQGIQQGLEQGIQQGLEQGIQQGLEQGVQQGLEQGVQQGLEQGVQQGLEQGKLDAQIAIAQQLLGVLDNAAISRTTGLSLEQIAQLRNI